jgi:hypothetical protein
MSRKGRARASATAELQDLPVMTISRIMSMLIPFRTDKMIGRLLNVSMTAVGQVQTIIERAKFSPDTERLTVCQAGDQVADREKGGLHFLSSGYATFCLPALPFSKNRTGGDHA